MNHQKVCIIILNWNGLEDTIECLESLKKITYPNYEVILVDNGSEGKDAEVLRERFSDYIHLIENDKNYGFAEGNNIAMRYALQNLSPDYILLLNNDTTVEPNFLTELVKVAESDPRIGIVGPKTYYYDYDGRKDVIWFAGGKFSGRFGKTNHLGARRIDKGQFESIRKVDYITGCAFLVKNETLDKIGLLSEDYFLYLEDLDLCIRAQKEQYYCFYVPKAKIWHKVSQSSGGRIGRISLYYNTRNRALFMKKNALLFDRICFSPFYLIRFVLIPSVYCVLKLRMWECLAVLQGFFDFLNHGSGKAKYF